MFKGGCQRRGNMQVSVCASEPEEVTTLFPDEGSMRVCEQLEFNVWGG